MQSSWETEEVPICRVEQRVFHLSHASWSLWAKTLMAHLDINSGDWKVGHEETCPTASASTPLAFGVPSKLEHVRGLLVPTGPNSLLATALPHGPPWLQVKEVGLLLGSFLEVEQLLGLCVLAQWSFCQHQLVVDGFLGHAGVFAAEERGAGDLLMETLLWHVHLEKQRQDSVPSVTHQTYPWHMHLEKQRQDSVPSVTHQTYPWHMHLEKQRQDSVPSVTHQTYPWHMHLEKQRQDSVPSVTHQTYPWHMHPWHMHLEKQRQDSVPSVTHQTYPWHMHLEKQRQDSVPSVTHQTYPWHMHLEKQRQDSVPSVTHQTYPWHMHLEKQRQDSVPSVTHQTYPWHMHLKKPGHDSVLSTTHQTYLWHVHLKKLRHDFAPFITRQIYLWHMHLKKPGDDILYLLLLIKHISYTCTLKKYGHDSVPVWQSATSWNVAPAQVLFPLREQIPLAAVYTGSEFSSLAAAANVLTSPISGIETEQPVGCKLSLDNLCWVGSDWCPSDSASSVIKSWKSWEEYAAIELYWLMKILHTLIAMVSTALAVQVLYPVRWPNFLQGTRKY